MANQKSGKRYNNDFRKMVVDLYRSGQLVRELSCEYGNSEVTIYVWIKKSNPVELEDGSSVTPNDYAKMEKEMLKLQQESRIFKKAMAILAKKVTDKDIVEVIDQERAHYPVHRLFAALRVSKSTYYQSLTASISIREQENQQVTKVIVHSLNDSTRRYL